MPAIHVRTGVSIPEETRARIQSELGKAIELLPGKSEQWLMVDVTGDCRLHFQGKCDEGIAFISVRVYGEVSAADADRLTGKLTELVGNTLDIPPRNIYVQYESCSVWGWNGSNF